MIDLVLGLIPAIVIILVIGFFVKKIIYKKKYFKEKKTLRIITIITSTLSIYFLGVYIVFSVIFKVPKIDFDKSIWIGHNDLLVRKNPRLKMIDDLMDNHLKVGMDKKEVIELLGKPYRDTISLVLPKGSKLPDSLAINYDIKQSRNEREKSMNKINAWYKENYESAPLIAYPIGWSLIDPIFLKIKLNDKEVVLDFWVEQH